jgi:hypothetical protein
MGRWIWSGIGSRRWWVRSWGCWVRSRRRSGIQESIHSGGIKNDYSTIGFNVVAIHVSTGGECNSSACIKGGRRGGGGLCRRGGRRRGGGGGGGGGGRGLLIKLEFASIGVRSVRMRGGVRLTSLIRSDWVEWRGLKWERVICVGRYIVWIVGCDHVIRDVGLSCSSTCVSSLECSR